MLATLDGCLLRCGGCLLRVVGACYACWVLAMHDGRFGRVMMLTCAWRVLATRVGCLQRVMGACYAWRVLACDGCLLRVAGACYV